MIIVKMTAEELAQKFHETYEELAPSHGYETRKASAVPWENVPANNKSLMIAVCKKILEVVINNTREITLEQMIEIHQNHKQSS